MADQYGSVYVFNLSGEAIEAFAPNGLTAGAIANWTPPTGDAPYTPAQLAVSRVEQQSNSPGNFVNGDNSVLFKASMIYNFSIYVPPEIPLGQDLLLYVSRNFWALYTTEGALWEQGEVRPGTAFGFKL